MSTPEKLIKARMGTKAEIRGLLARRDLIVSSSKTKILEQCSTAPFGIRCSFVD
jgi:hypothetical protein